MAEFNKMNLDIPINDQEHIRVEVTPFELPVSKRRGRPLLPIKTYSVDFGPKINPKKVSPEKLQALRKKRRKSLQTVYCKKYRDKQRTKSQLLELDLIFESNKNEELKAKIYKIKTEMTQIKLELLKIHPLIDFSAIFMEKCFVNKDFDISQMVMSSIEVCCGTAITNRPLKTQDPLAVAMDTIKDEIIKENINEGAEDPLASEIPIENISFGDYYMDQCWSL